ncbi:hypothetical protein OG292_03165 [Streptomyces sp. NBC_01511]|uniref:hypothetical protein n=1 Tax=Streptomyces sp. NBC_01511 TaxID=2903889 RepID=UPI00386F5841
MADKKIVTRYKNGSGALVVVFEMPFYPSQFGWECGGCAHDATYPQNRETANSNAQKHADACRALPAN